jgi:hypothetical protein
MEFASSARIEEDRCQWLRWKGMFVLSESSIPHSGDRLFWCHKTQQCIGPDAKLADDYECNETRGCYDAL